MKLRLDVALVERGLAESRRRAQALILAGNVRVNGQRADKSGREIPADAAIEVAQPLTYVSRGGLKLEAALKHFSIDVNDKICLDIGTSTGGFTDCLLQHGAVRVHAIDTGAGQIDWKLRSDTRVVLHENTNARYLRCEQIGELADLITCDVSFISTTLLFPALIPVLRPGGEWVILVKPQFEAGRQFVGRGGIVRDPAAHTLACEIVSSALQAHGFQTSIIESPILGVKGNKEFLLHAKLKD